MSSALSFLWTVALVTGAPLDAQFAQAAPVIREAPPFERSAGQRRAVVLLQGLRAHPFSSRSTARADRHGWQRPGSPLVKVLAQEADVYVFAYGQTVAVDRIVKATGFANNIRQLKLLGYAEIVLVGHSAGGLIARQFVEDHPEAGVTKVIQVGAPNGGSSWAKANWFVPNAQGAFIGSLTKEGRRQCLAKRTGKTIPEHVEFVCLIGLIDLHANLSVSNEIGGEGEAIRLAAAVNARGDGMVSSDSQWTEELQEQGIPAVPIGIDHFTIMRSKAGAEKIAQLIREPQPRWNAARVAEARQRFFGTEESRP
jgi:hypothetical protein